MARNIPSSQILVMLHERVEMVPLTCRRFHDFAPGKHFLPRNIALRLIAEGRASLIEKSNLP